MAIPELATVSQVKDWLGITGSAQDTVVTRLLNAAEYMARSICNRPDGWVAGTHTQKFETVCADAVSLTYDPVTSITSVSAVLSYGNSQTVDSSNYRIDDGDSILRVYGDPISSWLSGWPAGTMQYGYTSSPATTTRAYPYLSVVYVGGYASDAIPSDLTQAAINIAAQLYYQKGRDPNMKSETLGHRSYTLMTPQEIMQYAANQLADYIRVPKGFFG